MKKIIIFSLSIFLLFVVGSTAQAFYPYLGGTGTSTAPTGGQLLIGYDDGLYNLSTLTAGSNITISTSSGTIIITGSGESFSTSTNNYWFDNTSGITGNTNIITVGTLTTASGNISLWTNDANYLEQSTASTTYAQLNKSVTFSD